jgi:hypothetical protein
VWPTCNEDESIETEIVVTTGGGGGAAVMLNDAVPKTEPIVALITALPSAAAVTTPEADTLANAGVFELHVTLCPDISAPN